MTLEGLKLSIISKVMVMSKKSLWKAIVITVSVIASTSILNYAAAQKTSGPPNILFLFSDDQSAPDLGSYGNSLIQTPNLDQLAREGIQFVRAYVSSSQCSPSRASVLTGRTPHDVRASRLHMPVSASTPNVVKLLKQQGYYTGAYRKIHQHHIRKDFDFYGNRNEPLDAFFKQRPENRPFFLWFGSTDPHRTYKSGAFNPPHNPSDIKVPDFLPDTPAVRQDLAYYYDEIARFDQECGYILDLLDKYRLSENTMVIMSSDNGMPFPRGKATLFEPGIKVPLIIKWPEKIKAGTVSEELVSLTDLTATWLDAAAIEVPNYMQSRSLLPLLTGKQHVSRKYIFAERNWHDNWDPTRTIVGKRYKLIQRYRPEVGYQFTLDRLHPSPNNSFHEILRLQKNDELSGVLKWYDSVSNSRPQVEFYDLKNDPGEWNNLAGVPKYESLIIKFQKALSQWMDETHDFLPPPLSAFPGRFDSRYNQTYDPLDASARER